ncbi:hypothetical protein ACFL9U_15840 [Thermodesulfobacteriota bacterium]
MQEITCTYCGKGLVDTKNPNNGRRRVQIKGHYYFNNQTICTGCWDKRKRMRSGPIDLEVQTSIDPLKPHLPLKKTQKTEDNALT